MAFVINRLLHRDPTACRTFFQWIYLYAANPRGCSSAWLLIRVAAHPRWPFIRVAAHPLWLAGLLVALAGYGGSCWSLWVALLPAESTTCSAASCSQSGKADSKGAHTAKEESDKAAASSSCYSCQAVGNEQSTGKWHGLTEAWEECGTGKGHSLAKVCEE